ncbi:hypothetical protein F5Y01DRAFT_36693 [Xylaria sp. FL0043]|nr:hypothetical protein F5Y01DRAFT_36693 [Xylaria sp. FL0043]
MLVPCTALTLAQTAKGTLCMYFPFDSLPTRYLAVRSVTDIYRSGYHPARLARLGRRLESLPGAWASVFICMYHASAIDLHLLVGVMQVCVAFGFLNLRAIGASDARLKRVAIGKESCLAPISARLTGVRYVSVSV